MTMSINFCADFSSSCIFFTPGFWVENASGKKGA